jgi:hypothetical protein
MSPQAAVSDPQETLGFESAGLGFVPDGNSKNIKVQANDHDLSLNQ